MVGELNRWHAHALPEDEYPLVIRRFAGDEGLNGNGLSLYSALPFQPLGGAYELTVQATSGENEVLFLDSRRPSANAQLSGFWQLSRSTFAQLSGSGLYGTNPDSNFHTRLGVAAARLTWRPPQQGQARELTLRGEYWVLDRSAIDAARYSAAVPVPGFAAGAVNGWYADGSWKLDRRWTVTTRGDYVQSPEFGSKAHEWAVTPTLTFWESEFVYIRGIYEHHVDVFNSKSDRLSMQVNFSMGPHKHEIF